ncbi:hypothetical protein [Sinorhizobium chiapasense]|uniref:Uncharacterized protein n=1 Tax=Sinorhizobium chiapasense TaxID=501572 RepID=A0ABZ2BEW3_9HYPH
MNIDFALAQKAASLARKGVTGKDLGVKLGVKTMEANTLAAIGAKEEARHSHRLTVPEIELLNALAAEHAYLLRAGETRGPKSKDVAWRARRSDGWAAATAQKRIFDERPDETQKRTVRGMGFVHVAGNGYMWLTPAGWALIHFMGGAE